MSFFFFILFFYSRNLFCTLSDSSSRSASAASLAQDSATAGDQFRLSDGQWIFNLDTKGTGMSMGIWLLRATLSDGSQHAAWIQLK